MKRMFWRSRSGITEEAETGTPVSIEAIRPRRRMKVILTLALSGTLAGFMVSYVFPPKYTSTSTVLVEGQKVPDDYVKPVIISDFTQRIQTLQQQVLSPTRLRPVIQSLNLVKPDEEGKLIEDIQQNMRVEPVITSMSAAAQAGTSDAKKEASATDEPVPGFNVEYTDSNAARAEKICNAMTSLILDENLRSRAEVVQDITEFLNRELEEAKRTLDEQDAKIAAFKKQYMGKVPTDTRGAMSPSIEGHTSCSPAITILTKLSTRNCWSRNTPQNLAPTWRFSNWVSKCTYSPRLVFLTLPISRTGLCLP